MKHLFVIVLIGVVGLGCSNNSALDVDIEKLKPDCTCLKVYYDAHIESIEIELEGLSIQEKDIKENNFDKSNLFYKEHVIPAKEKTKEIVDKCGELGVFDEFSNLESPCYKFFNEFEENSSKIYNELVSERTRIQKLARKGQTTSPG